MALCFIDVLQIIIHMLNKMVHFYNKKRNLVMVLSDFAITNSEENIMSFNAEISYEGFMFSSFFKDHKYLFELLKKELTELYNRERNKVNFFLTERQLCIDFEYTEYGRIICKAQINHFDLDDEMCHSFLNVEFELDQSFLPELIREIDNIVKECIK